MNAGPLEKRPRMPSTPPHPGLVRLRLASAFSWEEANHDGGPLGPTS